ncbi:MAG: arginyl-tRNA synthetase [Candidatus Azotimanducaceae bacterium]|jgi:arginyl-tRNA synthetase
MNLKQYLDDTISAALTTMGAENCPAIVKQAQKPEFGHYQANGVMGAAKKLKTNPRELAAKLVQQLDLKGVEKLEIAGPGFINIHLSTELLAAELLARHSDPHLGVAKKTQQTIVVDYSAPNLAKEMHIGHLRSTAIGDAAVRILEYLGHKVIRANHVGDWGAQFGSLLAYLAQRKAEGAELYTELKDLEVFYQTANKLFKADEDFAKIAREYVVRLQSGDAACLELWRTFIEESATHCQAVYDKLNITLTREDIQAESQYNQDLPVIISELEQKALIEESDGAKCVFLDEFIGKDKKPLPAIIQKSDGGFPYMATDIAAVRHRTGNLKADAAYYFIDARQKLHIAQLFGVSKAAGYLTDQTFRHLPFGVILKADGTPFKTRDGAAVKLIDVIDEAIDRAYQLVSEKNPELTDDERRNVARVVGVGAIKYAELSKNRTTDYIFDWDTMLSFEGNTAPYLQYAYTRIRSVFRRSNIDASMLTQSLRLSEPAEISLALKLLQFEEALDAAIEDFQANVLCNYLFELAGLFMSFYEQCPILQSADEIKNSRLLLAEITANTLQQGLSLLGIETVEQM